MSPRKKTKEPSISDMMAELAANLVEKSKRPDVNGYIPHKKQEVFHKSEAKSRLYIGGNRSGKTTAAVVEDIYWLRGNHPCRKVPEGPIRGRVVGVDFLQGVQKIIIPEFKRWMPPSLLKNGSWDDSYSRELRTLTLTNGSMVEFMSYDQDTDKFAGTSRHFCHYDEEPPEHVFNECNARLVDTNGDWWISMTPVEGMTWIYDKVYKPGTENPNSGVLVVEADMLDNPHISPEAAERFLSGLDESERKAREHGTFVSLGGRVYKEFSRETHVISPYIPPKEWEWYISLDHGFNNPTAVLWHAVSPDNEVITFGEHYASGMLISEHAEVIHATNKAFGKEPEVWVADPALAQTQGVTGVSIFSEYADRGCYFAPGNNNVQTGVARVSQYVKPHPRTGKPLWHITENCANLITEMLHLRWKTFASKKVGYENNPQEKIQKKNDHASDSARYFFSFLPDLTPPEFEQSHTGGLPELTLATGVSPVSGTIDDYLASISKNGEVPQTSWRTTVSTDISALEYE